jgi:transposase InsO family protein
MCTSHVERMNLSLRTFMKRFARLTLSFSKKWENLRAALAWFFCYYNFGRVHGSIRVTPAMEIKLTDHIWSIEEILEQAAS